MSPTIVAQKAQKLLSQWPKVCKCCGTAYNPASWAIRPLGFTMRDTFATQEARHCTCGSTLVVLREIHDLAEE